MADKKKDNGLETVARNKKAYHDYFVLESFEAGIELFGTEVKSVRQGKVNLKDAWCSIEKGEIYVNGTCVFDSTRDFKGVSRTAQRQFGLVFQQFNLFPQYNVLENLTLAPHLLDKHRPKAEIEAEARALLEKVGLTEKAKSYPCELSGGQQQRVAIARALMLSPAILCFDEPTSALDPELTGEVLRVIKSLKSGDRTMIIVTHEMAFARQVSDKVMFIADGLIEEMGIPEEVFDHPKSEKLKAFLHNDGL